MRFSWLLAVFLTASLTAAAEPLAFNLMASPQSALTADRLSIDVVVLNSGSTDQLIELPPQLTGELRIGSQMWPVQLEMEAVTGDASRSSLVGISPSNDLAVAAGSFARRTYRFVPPAGASGLAVLELQITGQPLLRGAIDVASPAQTASAASPRNSASRNQRPTTNLARSKPAAAVLERTLANRIAPHEPVYFIYGPDAPAAKFQFSFKYKLLGFDDGSPGTMAQTLQFGFTQRSLWDLGGVSSPFYDTSYMPELIYESLAAEPDESDRWFTWLGFQAAYKHESNGRDGPLSRSLNTVYLRPVIALGALDGWHLLVMPEVFTYLDTLEDNTRLKDYRGYGQLRLVLGRNAGLSLMATLWSGKNFDHSSAQLDLTMPVKTRLLDFQVYLLLQYFNGYGESLLSYDQKTETVRAGLSFVR